MYTCISIYCYKLHFVYMFYIEEHIHIYKHIYIYTHPDIRTHLLVNILRQPMLRTDDITPPIT